MNYENFFNNKYVPFNVITLLTIIYLHIHDITITMYNKLDPTIQHIFTNVIFVNYKCIVIVNEYNINYI